jgi:hypothetical protein
MLLQRVLEILPFVVFHVAFHNARKHSEHSFRMVRSNGWPAADLPAAGSAGRWSSEVTNAL